jgi:hypothetical protein
VRAFNVEGIRSDFASVNSIVVAASATASASVTVNVKPMPPLVTVATTAYELRALPGGTFQFVAVGTVPLGAECGMTLVGAYTQFTGAMITKPLTGGIIAARCRAA